jgi:hypothetical protein
MTSRALSRVSLHIVSDPAMRSRAALTQGGRLERIEIVHPLIRRPERRAVAIGATVSH